MAVYTAMAVVPVGFGVGGNGVILPIVIGHVPTTASITLGVVAGAIATLICGPWIYLTCRADDELPIGQKSR